MKTDCLFCTVAIIKADTDCNIAIDVHKLADQMVAMFSDIDRDELLRVIHHAIVVVHGTVLQKTTADDNGGSVVV